MEESTSSPFTCPNTVTIRRNPPRRARPTPSHTATATATATATDSLNISSFPLNDILSIDLAIPSTTTATTVTDTLPSITDTIPNSTSLKVFLRLRPLSVIAAKKTGIVKKDVKGRLGKVKKGSVKSCLVVNDFNSVTITPPNCDSSRLKSEVYAGFSRVFDSDSSQDEVYDSMMRPIVEEFLNGRSGLLAALGPSGSGKTHTVFGSAKEPGLIPRALRHIFEAEIGNKSMSSRSFYLSIFEICLEKGKGERLCDLSPDGGEIHIQQSVVKGLKEVLIKDVAQAEAILAGAKLKRATAMTNSNTQSSRSQCIINIRCTIGEAEGESESPLNGTGLTFVDLAGAEREKKTGNQGGRLLESNFINNTSMVFSLCLRSLLEHQKNPKKPLQKHFQSSLLTRYLRDYLEGRKRMALILTARSGPEDYFDASFLLRQASPYMEIKFHNVEETTKLPGNKRRNQATCNDKQKKVKLCNADEKGSRMVYDCDTVQVFSGCSKTDGKDDGGRIIRDSSSFTNEDVCNEVKGGSMLEASETAVEELNNPSAKLQRDYYAMQGFAKALWNALKQYKERVKGMQNEIDLLTENLSSGHERYLAMEKELHDLKSHCSCQKQFQINNVCFIGGTNSPCRDSVLEVDHGQVGSPKVQVLEALDYGEKMVLYPSREQCPIYTDHNHAGVIAPEEQHKVSPSLFKAASFSTEKDDHHHLVGATVETSFSEAGYKLETIEIRLPGHENLEGKYGLSELTLQDGLGEIQDLDPPVVCEVHLGDSPSTTKISASVDAKDEHDTILRTPYDGALLPFKAPYGQVASPKAQGLVALECEENPVLYSSSEQYPLYHKRAGTIAREEQHKVSPIKCKAASFLQEKNHHNHLGEILETSFSEARSNCEDIEIRQPQHEDSEGNYEFSETKILYTESGEIQDLKPTVVCEVHLGDSPSTTKTFSCVDGKTEHDAILRTPFEGAVLLTRDFESSIQQDCQEKFAPMECEISLDPVCINDCHENDQVEKTDKILTDAADCFHKSHVMELKGHRENNSDSTAKNKDKENVTNSPPSNRNSKLEAEQISSFKTLKTERPKRRLMPASSLLLRDAGNLDVTDDSVKIRRGRGGQKLAEDESKRTRGSATLLRLLKNHLPR